MRLQSRAIVLTLVAGAACALAFAQTSSAPGKPAEKPTDKQTTSTPAKPAKAVEFPPAPKKKLYAKKDVRGQEAPKLTVGKWLTNEPKTEGKVVLIDFWATWCPPCRELIPELEQWQAKFKDDLVIIGISDEKESKVKDFYKKGMKYASAIDEKATMKKALGVEGIPHVLIIGSDNIVRWQGFPGDGTDPLTEAKVKQIIDADKARRAEAEKKPK